MFTISVTLCEIITFTLTKCSRFESSTFKKQAVMSYNVVKYVVEWLFVCYGDGENMALTTTNRLKCN